MLTRNLGIAILVSLGVHIAWMSVVSITTPEEFGRIGPYARVDFLGSILTKTAFDIMLADTSTVIINSYDDDAQKEADLKAKVTKTDTGIKDVPEHDVVNKDEGVRDFLSGDKDVQEMSEGSKGHVLETDTMDRNVSVRRVIYRPEPPVIMRGIYGDKDTFKVKVKVLIDAGGEVKNAEPVTTTGYPRLDIQALKFVRYWIFDQRDNVPGSDEWQEIEVILNAGAR